jgi:hypothetical protein
VNDKEWEEQLRRVNINREPGWGLWLSNCYDREASSDYDPNNSDKKSTHDTPPNFDA